MKRWPRWVVVVLCLLCPIGYAQVNNWTNNADDKWETGANWSLGVAPTSGQSIFITNANNKIVTIDAVTSGSFPSTMSISSLAISAPSNSLNTLNLLNVGSTTPLSCDQSATIGAYGAITVSGASLVVTNANGTGVLTVGATSQGTLTLNGGTVMADQFVTTSNALLFINYGTLTTLHGSMVAPSSTYLPFQIGSASNQPAAWNVLGGTNLLLNNDPALSIGSGNALGIVTVSGPGTVLTNTGGIIVEGAPGSSLSVTNGANVQTTGGFYNALLGNNSIVVVGQSSRWDSTTSIIINGPNGRFSILDGAQVSCANPTVGQNTYNPGNVVTVEGSNSTWNISGVLSFGPQSANNTLIITNGGSVICYGTTINQYNFNQSYNSIVVAGSGSTWLNQSWVYVENANHFTITIEDGGQSACSDFDAESTTGQVLVTGIGSVWNVSGGITLQFLNQLTVADGGLVNNGGGVYVGGPQTGCQLVLTNGGTLVTATLGIGEGRAWQNHSNSLVIVGGDLVVTNSDANALLEIHSGALLLNGGVITVDDLLVDNVPKNAAVFSAGTIHTRGTTIANSSQFIVGDGSQVATYNMIGGVHSFTNGLQISANSALTGCGTIIGNVSNYGRLAVNCPGGTLTLNGIVTNNGIIIATNNADIEFLGRVVNNGTIDVINGYAHFLGGFVNHGTYRDAGTALKMPGLGFAGNDAVISFGSVSGKIYVVEYTDDLVLSNWVALANCVTGNGGIMQFNDTSAATLTQRFYRVHLILP